MVGGRSRPEQAVSMMDVTVNALLKVVFGLLILAVPLLLAGAAIVTLAVALPLVPVLMPLTTALVMAGLLVLWWRWKRAD